MFNGWEAYDHYHIYTQNAPMHAEKMHESSVMSVAGQGEVKHEEKKKKKKNV